MCNQCCGTCIEFHTTGTARGNGNEAPITPVPPQPPQPSNSNALPPPQPSPPLLLPPRQRSSPPSLRCRAWGRVGGPVGLRLGPEQKIWVLSGKVLIYVMKYRLPKASTQFIHTPSVCGLLCFGWFGVFPDHHIPPYYRKLGTAHPTLIIGCASLTVSLKYTSKWL